MSQRSLGTGLSRTIAVTAEADDAATRLFPETHISGSLAGWMSAPCLAQVL